MPFLRSLFCLAAGLALSANLPAALLVDDFEGAGPHLAGAWTAFCNPGSSIQPQTFHASPDGHASAQAGRLDYQLAGPADYPYAGFATAFAPQDLTRYQGVRFWARGSGNWSCQLALPATSAEHNHYSQPFSVGPDWRLVELPFGDFTQTWGGRVPWDAAQVNGLGWNAQSGAGQRGWLSVDDVAFYRADEATQAPPPVNPVLAEPKVDQVGYRPADPKAFVIARVDGRPEPGDAFWVLAEDGSTAYAGNLDAQSADDRRATGEETLAGDFSGLRRPGRYRVKAGGVLSQPFRVGADAFAPLFRDALHCFRVLRCGVALDDAATGLRHAACHRDDAALAGGGRAELRGGWHNADDYGKWVLEASLSCAWMLWLHELRGAALGPDDAVLLEEARWGLDWMLKMQRPDGSVLHKVDAQDHFCSGTPPEADPHNGRRLAQAATSIDAGDFVGAMGLAARAYAASDPDYARRCLGAARRAWTWLQAHPEQMELDPDYSDTGAGQERLWALGEMARVDKRLRPRFLDELRSQGLLAPSWQNPGFFGLLALLQDRGLEAGPRAELAAALERLAGDLAQRSEGNGYGVVTTADEYWWESNEVLLGRGGALFCAGALLEQPRYTRAGQRQLDWLLGLNSLGYSFVAGHGGRSMRHPWHWSMNAYGVLLPGWCAGGPNGKAPGADPLLARLIARGTPPAKCYVDAAQQGQGSWASNEGETSLNAALVFSAGWQAAR